MVETFKNVSIFIIFLVCAIFLDKLRTAVTGQFRFDYGETVLLMLWSTAVVIMFHLLYHYFGKWTEKVSYIIAGVMVILTVILLKTDVIYLN